MQIDILNTTDYIETARVIEMIIEEEAKTREVAISLIIKDVARYYNVDENIIKLFLKFIDSPYIYGNSQIVGYIDGKALKRTTHIDEQQRILKKLWSRLKKYLEKNDFSYAETFFEALQDHLYKSSTSYVN